MLKASRIGRVGALLILALIVQVPLISGEVEITEFASISNPVAIAWGGLEFIVARGDGETKLFTVSTDGRDVKPFAPSFTAKGDVNLAVSSSIGGFTAKEVYATSGDTVYRIDPQGRGVTPFATPVPGLDISHLTFDQFGYWGSRLIVATIDGRIWAVNADGKISLIKELEDEPLSVAAGPDEYGEFTGHLIVALKKSRQLVGIHPQDRSLKVLAEFGEEIPKLAMVISPFSNLFITSTTGGKILTIPKETFYKTARFIIVFTETETGEKGSIKIVESSRLGVKVSDLETGIDRPSFSGAVFAVQEEISKASERRQEEGFFSFTQGYALLFTGLAATAIVASVVLVFWKLWQR